MLGKFQNMEAKESEGPFIVSGGSSSLLRSLAGSLGPSYCKWVGVIPLCVS